MGSTLFSQRYRPRFGRVRLKRPKTFKTAELAKAWAAANKIEKYELVDMTPLKKAHKIKVIAK